MPSEEQDAARFRTWTARDWRELRAVWKGLVPEVGEAPPDEIVRRFRGEELSLQQAGWVFERWVLEAFRLSGAVIQGPYEVPMAGSRLAKEEIDALVFDGWQAFVVESKFWTQKVDFTPLAVLHYRVEQRPVGTLGLFFSAFNYKPAAIELCSTMRPIRTLLFQHEDLLWAIRHRNSMVEMVRRKWRLAVRYGQSHLEVDRPDA